jgi:hypothetical protein
METETERSIRSRIAVKPIIMLTAYTVVIYNTAVVSLVVFSLFDAGEPALRESAAIMVAFTPFILVVAIGVSVTHYAIERQF